MSTGQERIDRDAIVALLSPTLGQEKSEETIAHALQNLGYPADTTFSPEQASAILIALSKVDGLVGVVARFALARKSTFGPPTEPPEPAREPSTPPRPLRTSVPPGPPSSRPEVRVSAADLLGFLAPALGDEKAKEAISHHARSCGLGADHFSRAEAITTLEAMAEVDGILGVVARFAIARFILRYPS